MPVGYRFCFGLVVSRLSQSRLVFFIQLSFVSFGAIELA